MGTRSGLLLAAGLCCIGAGVAAQSTPTVFGNGFESSTSSKRFFEPFTWRGNHASTIDHTNSQGGQGHVGTTVWWNEDHWDVGGDTSYNATLQQPGTTGYHIDVHKSVDANPRNGEEDNEAFVVGGDGSPGVAAMRMNFEGILSARLRNPMLVSASQPGVVEFYAPKFVTTGHWWEISLTPATGSVTSGVNTNIPAMVSRPPFEDSLNFVAIGYDDIPCDTGWYARFDVHRTLAGVDTEYPMDFPGIGAAGFPVIDPNQKMALTHWRLEFFPDRVEFYGDLDANGSSEHLQRYNVGVPWPEVNVALLGVAYQADHHPQNCYQGITRELVWRDVSVEPVKYASTSSAPRNTVTTNVQRQLGWMAYDLRDLQRYGPPVAGNPQANAVKYDLRGHMAFTSHDLQVWDYAPPPVNEITLPVELTAAQGLAARARLIYDIKDTGTATLHVNGTTVGPMPRTSSIRYTPQAENGVGLEWVHRSIDIPPGLLHEGANQIRVSLVGNLAMDRLHLEFAHER